MQPLDHRRLWDIMAIFHAGLFMQHVRNIELTLHSVGNGQHNMALNVYAHIDAMLSTCTGMGLSVSNAKLSEAYWILRGAIGERAMENLSKGIFDGKLDKWSVDNRFGELGHIGTDFATTVALELRDKKFVRLEGALAQYYEQPEPFGSAVADRFPKGIDDIEGAAKCLALGQGTACVLHLMRVMELGLKDIAKRLRVTPQNDWGTYLREIRTRVSTKPKLKGVQWKKDESFYLDLSEDLMTVKQAWRNRTMHVVKTYSPEQAEIVFNAVRSLMQRLAQGPAH